MSAFDTWWTDYCRRENLHPNRQQALVGIAATAFNSALRHAAGICREEHLSDLVRDTGDEAYDRAVEDCALAIEQELAGGAGKG